MTSAEFFSGKRDSSTTSKLIGIFKLLCRLIICVVLKVHKIQGTNRWNILSRLLAFFLTEKLFFLSITYCIVSVI